MKTITNLLSTLMLAVLFISFSQNVVAQGHGKGKGHDKGKHDRDNYYNQNHEQDRHYFDERRRYPAYSDNHRNVTYRHHKHHHPSWAPVYGHRYNTRYIYYQDYNVYYDCQRDVFLTWSGRNWVVSSHIPNVMYRVNFTTARVYGVDYWDDDISFYLQRRRPVQFSLNANW